MKKNFLLQPVGLDKKTEVIYRALLSLADAPVSTIARRAGIKRTSAYHILENLAAMGLTTTYVERGVKRFAAEHPSKLKTFFERQAIMAERIIPELTKEISKSRLAPSIRVFEGKDAVKSMSEEALKAKDKIILSIGSTKRLSEFLGGKYGWGKRRREAGIFQKALRFKIDEVIEHPSRLHEVKILPESFNFPGYILIFDNSVGIIPLEEPARGILITSRSFSVMLKSIFEVLWKV